MALPGTLGDSLFPSLSVMARSGTQARFELPSSLHSAAMTLPGTFGDSLFPHTQLDWSFFNLYLPYLGTTHLGQLINDISFCTGSQTYNYVSLRRISRVLVVNCIVKGK